MTYSDFKKKWLNKGIDFDGHYGFQCVDLARQYCKEVLGVTLSPPVEGASDIWNSYNQDAFDRVSNTPEGLPQQGDIVIWNKRYGPYGHIAVFDSGDLNSFVAFSQNDPLGSLSSEKKYTYSNIYGWLHPKGNMSDSDTVQLDSKTFEKLVGNSTKWDEVQKLGYTTAAQIKSDVDAYKEEIKNLKAEASSQKARADANRQEFVELLARIAKALNVVQEVVQVNSAIDKLSTDLNLLDDLKISFSQLQLHSNEQIEALNAEINRLKLLGTSFDDATWEEIINTIVKKLLKIVRKV